MTKFIYPYTFVMLPTKRQTAPKDKGELYGKISCRLTTRSAVIIPNTSYDMAFYEDGDIRQNGQMGEIEHHHSYNFFSYNNLRPSDTPITNEEASEARKKAGAFYEPVIPGSSLRGMIRSVYEALTGSCLSQINNERVSHRRLLHPLTSGLLIREGQDLVLYEAERNAVLFKGAGETWHTNLTGFNFGTKLNSKKFQEGQHVWFKSASLEYTSAKGNDGKRPVVIKVSSSQGNGCNKEGYLHLGESFSAKRFFSLFSKKVKRIPNKTDKGNNRFFFNEKPCSNQKFLEQVKEIAKRENQEIWYSLGNGKKITGISKHKPSRGRYQLGIVCRGNIIVEPVNRQVDNEHIQELIALLSLYADSQINLKYTENQPSNGHRLFDGDQHRGYKEYRKLVERFQKGEANVLPVYYFKYCDENGKADVRLTPACYSKDRQQKQLRDILERGSFNPCYDERDVCPACSLFGTVNNELVDGENVTLELPGRIRVRDATLTEDSREEFPNDRELYEDIVTLTGLASPKPTSSALYLRRPEGKRVAELAKGGVDAHHPENSENPEYADWTLDHKFPEKGIAESYDADINGRKFYWHHKENDWKARCVDRSNSDYQKIRQQPLSVTVRPLQSDVEFGFDVYFDGVTQQELKELIGALTLGEEKGADGHKKRLHAIGHAKPFGFGCVEIAVDKVFIRSLRREDGKIVRELKDETADYQPKPLHELFSGDSEMAYIAAQVEIATTQFDFGYEIMYPIQTMEPNKDDWYKNIKWAIQKTIEPLPPLEYLDDLDNKLMELVSFTKEPWANA
jgi:CRISPR-associated protein (TIGR03986 family)